MKINRKIKRREGDWLLIKCYTKGKKQSPLKSADDCSLTTFLDVPPASAMSSVLEMGGPEQLSMM